MTVGRGGELYVTAPRKCPRKRVEMLVRKKTFWVYKKLALKEKLFRSTAEKEYVSGECFYHLGRSYRLKLVSENGNGLPLRLLHGRFSIDCGVRQQAPDLFRSWYATHDKSWIERRVELFADRFEIDPRPVEIRDLGYAPRFWQLPGNRKINRMFLQFTATKSYSSSEEQICSVKH